MCLPKGTILEYFFSLIICILFYFATACCVEKGLVDTHQYMHFTDYILKYCAHARVMWDLMAFALQM